MFLLCVRYHCLPPGLLHLIKQQLSLLQFLLLSPLFLGLAAIIWLPDTQFDCPTYFVEEEPDSICPFMTDLFQGAQCPQKSLLLLRKSITYPGAVAAAS